MNLLQRPRPYNGVARLPQAIRIVSVPPPTLRDRVLIGLIYLGLIVSALAAIALALLFSYISIQLGLAIVHTIKEGFRG